MKLPPNDRNAFYIIMDMAEEITTLVYGQAAKVIIIMDINLYERALKIPLSTDKYNRPHIIVLFCISQCTSKVP